MPQWDIRATSQTRECLNGSGSMLAVAPSALSHHQPSHPNCFHNRMNLIYARLSSARHFALIMESNHDGVFDRLTSSNFPTTTELWDEFYDTTETLEALGQERDEIFTNLEQLLATGRLKAATFNFFNCHQRAY